MRRIALIVALLSTLVVPGSVAARSERCSVAIAPSVGSPTDIYRITVSNVPVIADRSVEVRTDIRLLGTRTGAIIFAFLIPGASEFYVDYNAPLPDEPPTALAPGRYAVEVTTPHLSGSDACHTVTQFEVR